MYLFLQMIQLILLVIGVLYLFHSRSGAKIYDGNDNVCFLLFYRNDVAEGTRNPPFGFEEAQ